MEKLLTHMLTYQKKNNIKGECFSNALMFYDIMEQHIDSCRFVTGILHYYDTKLKNNVLVCHSWCQVNGVDVETSYEYKSVPYQKTYFPTLNAYFKKYSMTLEDKKKLIDIVANFEIKARKCIENPKMVSKYYQELRSYLLTVPIS